MTLRPLVVGAARAVLALGLAACGADDRDMARPSSSQTTTTFIRGTTTTVAGAPQPVALHLSTSSFTPDGVIPDDFTCNGIDVPPDLSWTNVPAGTVELALVMDDPDADEFVHWVVTGIDPTTTGLFGGQLPAGAAEANNGFGNPGWAGPCPPEGTGVHHYRFQLYALQAPLGVEAGADANEAKQAVLNGMIIQQAALGGTVEAA